MEDTMKNRTIILFIFNISGNNFPVRKFKINYIVINIRSSEAIVIRQKFLLCHNTVYKY